MVHQSKGHLNGVGRWRVASVLCCLGGGLRVELLESISLITIATVVIIITIIISISLLSLSSYLILWDIWKGFWNISLLFRGLGSWYSHKIPWKKQANKRNSLHLYPILLGFAEISSRITPMTQVLQWYMWLNPLCLSKQWTSNHQALPVWNLHHLTEIYRLKPRFLVKNTPRSFVKQTVFRKCGGFEARSSSPSWCFKSTHGHPTSLINFPHHKLRVFIPKLF